MRLSVEEVPATPAMASMLMVIHLLQRSVLRRPDTETCAVRSAHASREVLDRSLSCGRSVDAIGAPQRLRCQLPHIGASGAPAASNEACWCATATPTGQSKPTVRETPFSHTVQFHETEPGIMKSLGLASLIHTCLGPSQPIFRAVGACEVRV